MYITIMDYSTKTISKMVWDVVFEFTTTEQVEDLLVRCGFRLPQINYMITEDEPDYGGCIEVSDLLGDSV